MSRQATVWYFGFRRQRKSGHAVKFSKNIYNGSFNAKVIGTCDDNPDETKFNDKYLTFVVEETVRNLIRTVFFTIRKILFS